MKEINIIAKISVCSYEELNEVEKNLVEAAKAASLNAYAPYSKFQVGAAVLLDSGQVITANNQENAAYPSGLCAERTVLFYSGAQFPENAVNALAVAGFTNGHFTSSCITPCGACRQVISEVEKRFGQSISILLYGEKEIYKIHGVKDILPLPFEG